VKPTTPGDIRRALAARDSAVLRAEAEAREDAADAWERACRAPRRWPRRALRALALLALAAGLAWLIERLPPGLGATLVAVVATWAVVVTGLGWRPR
jgi:ferric-dicitrate binding protein FerR (iron transport regulator)